MRKNKEHLVVKIYDQDTKHLFFQSMHDVSLYRKDWC